MTNNKRDSITLEASSLTRKKALRNIKKWGPQDVDTLLHAMMEELGEIAHAHLEKEGDERMIAESRDLGALCIQMETLLKS